MSVAGVLISGCVGVLCAMVSLLIENRIFGRSNGRRVLKLVTLAVVFAVSTAVSGYFVQPYFLKRGLRTDIAAELAAMKDIPVYGYVRQYDPETYSAIVDELAAVVYAHRDATKSELYAFYGKRGGDLGLSYIAKSSPDVKKRYFEATVRVLEDLNSVNSDLACRYLFPEVYGPAADNTAVKVMTMHGVFDLFEEAIRESAKTPAKGGFSDKTHLEAFQKEFARKHPVQMSAIVNIDRMKTDDQKKFLVNSVIMFYKTVLKKGDAKAEAILDEII